MSGEYDDGDSGGPTSHRYLYDMDRDELFTIFAGAAESLRVGDDGCRCLPAEAMALSRMARAVEVRVDPGTAREAKLGFLATVLRVLLARTDGRDRGEDQYWYEPMPDLVAHFLEARADAADFTPTPPASVPDGVPTGFIESLRDGPNPDGQPGVSFDVDGRPWIEPDPDDEVSEGEDIVSEENGYRWHTDGRPPEPLSD